MKAILLFLLLIASSTASADSNPDKLNELESALNGVRQEQQSVYQNYQMAKELRLMEVQQGSTAAAQPTYSASINMPPPNYDDVVRAQLEREQRIGQYTDDLKRLSARYLELEGQRKSLLDEIREVKRQQGE